MSSVVTSPVAPEPRPAASAASRTTLSAVGVAFFAVVLLRTAWMSDAAFLTLRTVEHAASGLGLRWNAAERVQVFDHPLWLLTLLGGRLLTGETYLTTLAISIGCSLLCAALVLRRAGSAPATVMAAAAMALSPLFVSFSTSGLESPLLHLLAAGLVLGALAHHGSTRPPAWLAALAGLALLTRWSMILIAVPCLVPLFARSNRRARATAVALALGPLLLWALWAWWYYGTLGTNASLADGHARIASAVRLRAGQSFLASTAQIDPLLGIVLAAGLLIGAVAGGLDAWLALGALLSGAFVMMRGGSAMAGRDLTLPFLVALILATRRLAASSSPVTWAAAAMVALVGAVAPKPTYSADSRYGGDFRRTARSHDSRAEFYQATGLLLESRPRAVPDHPEARRARELASTGATVAASSFPGMFGFAAGRDIHVIDAAGRTTPLLARLPPAVGARWQWTADRRFPAGYQAGRPLSELSPSEAPLAQLDQLIQVATRAPLTAPGRLGLLLRLPAETRRLVGESSYGPRIIPLDAIHRQSQDEPRVLLEGGVLVSLGEPIGVSHLAISLSAGYDYVIEMLDGESVVETIDSPRLGLDPGPESVRYLDLARRRNLTALRVRCGRGTGTCRLGDVNLGS